MSESKESLVGRRVELASLVDYAPGAVVSREVMKRPAGTVTVFAFDKGQGLSECGCTAIMS